MAVEDQVRDLLHELTPYPPLGLDGAAVARSARRRHRRRIALVTLPAVVVVVALVLGGTAFLGRSDRPRPEPPAGLGTGWYRIADLPLSPRKLPLVVWTGEEALVVGGVSEKSASLEDGAAYDPAGDSWRTIAPAPEHLSAADFATAFVGHTLVVGTHDGLLAYDVDPDAWRRLPDPPHRVTWPTIAAADGHVYLLDDHDVTDEQTPVQVLDLASGTWSTLPLGPDVAAHGIRTLVWTPAGLVVMGDGLDSASGALWDGTRWVSFPDTDLRGSLWHWTGERVVSGWVASRRSATRSAALDPAAGAWSALPWLPVDSPSTLWSGGRMPADGPLVFSDSTVYDDADGSFTPVHPPEPFLTAPGLLLAGRTLFTFGGYLPDPGHQYDRVDQGTTTTHAWAYDVP
ncbi:hypothetical protein [Nocardioides aquiterrae]|uniref:Galactose oxidase n=1 Tax=Nocardioides aquiterrae TaxID=203799 RepID=A0ABN1UH62_9ACTN